MMRKYIVPDEFKRLFKNDVIYCKVLNDFEINTKQVYLVKMINYKNRTNIFAEDELQRCNLIDKLKILKYRRNK